MDFVHCLNGYALYFKIHDICNALFICFYADDFIFTSSNPSLLEELRPMALEFEMTGIGPMS